MTSRENDLLLRLLILRFFGLPLSHLCGYFSWLTNEVVTHQNNRHSINSNSTKANNTKSNKTTIIIILIILPLLLRINNNKCLRLNHERRNTFTLNWSSYYQYLFENRIAKGKLEVWLAIGERRIASKKNLEAFLNYFSHGFTEKFQSFH